MTSRIRKLNKNECPRTAGSSILTISPWNSKNTHFFLDDEKKGMGNQEEDNFDCTSINHFVNNLPEIKTFRKKNRKAQNLHQVSQITSQNIDNYRKQQTIVPKQSKEKKKRNIRKTQPKKVTEKIKLTLQHQIQRATRILFNLEKHHQETKKLKTQSVKQEQGEGKEEEGKQKQKKEQQRKFNNENQFFKQENKNQKTKSANISKNNSRQCVVLRQISQNKINNLENTMSLQLKKQEQVKIVQNEKVWNIQNQENVRRSEEKKINFERIKERNNSKVMIENLLVKRKNNRISDMTINWCSKIQECRTLQSSQKGQNLSVNTSRRVHKGRSNVQRLVILRSLLL